MTVSIRHQSGSDCRIVEHLLWDGTPPFANTGRESQLPKLTAYLPSSENNSRYAMLTFPGGGYGFLSKRSGREYGEWFSARGVAVIDVRFRLGSAGYDYRAKCADAYAALNCVRANANAWGFSADRVGVIGTSAGAHLAGVMCTGAGRQRLFAAGVGNYTDITDIPNFGVFCYGVMSLKEPLAHKETRRHFLGADADDIQARIDFSPLSHVGRHHPRSFLWHTAEDAEVVADNTWAYAKALRDNAAPLELHLYQKGEHALGLARFEGLAWADDCLRWIVS